MARLTALLAALAACASSSPAPAPQAPVAVSAPPEEVPPPEEPEEPEEYELADGNADDGSNPEETPDDLPVEASTKGALPKEDIRRVVVRHRSSLAACYEAQLVKQPGLAGRVETTFIVGADGKVTRATARGLHPAIEACLVLALRRMEFPRPTGGAVTVNYPFNFAAVR